MAIPAGDIDEAWGYTVRYDAAKAGLRVYATAAFGVVLITAGFLKGSELLIALGLGGLGVAYYFYPLAETKRARLGAN